METLILEVETRGLHRYFELERTVTRIGRALDNDIILSDPAVAPYHLKITITESAGITIENLADVNPTRINGRQHDRLVTTTLPVNLQIGRIKATLLPRSQDVAGARPLAGSHSRYIPSHPVWLLLLPLICLMIGGMQYFLGNFTTLRWGSLFSFTLRETALSIGLIIMALTVVERLLVNRWEVKLITISVCLAYIIYTFSSLLAYQTSYVLSSKWPTTIFDLGWHLFVIPAAISLYLIKFSHVKNIYSISLAIIMSSPYSIPAVLNSPLAEALSAEFDKSARYHSSLSALNWHRSKTSTIGEFIKEAESLESGRFVD